MRPVVYYSLLSIAVLVLVGFLSMFILYGNSLAHANEAEAQTLESSSASDISGSAPTNTPMPSAHVSLKPAPAEKPWDAVAVEGHLYDNGQAIGYSPYEMRYCAEIYFIPTGGNAFTMIAVKPDALGHYRINDTDSKYIRRYTHYSVEVLMSTTAGSIMYQSYQSDFSFNKPVNEFNFDIATQSAPETSTIAE